MLIANLFYCKTQVKSSLLRLQVVTDSHVVESCFERPNEFIPERWSTAGHLVKDRTGYAPFGLGEIATIRLLSCGELTIMIAGIYSCVGKNFALMEIRILTAMLLTRFHVAFATGENGEELFSRFHDHFTAAPGPLRLTFKKR